MINISIIITYYANKNILNLCLDNLIATTKEYSKNLEVIVVNDNPEQNIQDIKIKYERFIDIKLINMKQNSGYSAACNKGVLAAKYNNIILMDSDIIPSEDWLKQMIITYNDIDCNGCVSATILDMNTKLLYSYGVGIYGVDIILFHSFGEKDLYANSDRDFILLTSGCLLMPKSLYINCGLQDENYMNAFNDFELTFSNHLSGHKNRIASKAIVYHRGHVSGASRTNYRMDSKARLFQKWGTQMEYGTEQIIREYYSKVEYITNRSVIICSFSNSLSRTNYIDIFCEIHGLEILQFYDIKNLNNSKIILYDHLAVDLCMNNIPIIYFVDNYLDIKDNYMWFKNRINTNDIIIDKNLNIIEVSTLLK